MTKHYLEPGTRVYSDAVFELGYNGEHIYIDVIEDATSEVFVDELDDYMPIQFDDEKGQWYWED